MDTSLAEHPVSAAERAYTHVRRQLLTREIRPGEMLSEGAVAESVGVSRTPVREALLRLQAEGFVELLPKRGALVLPVTAEQMADVLQARRLVEVFAVRETVRGRVDPALVTALEGQLARMREAARSGDSAAYVIADRAFHAELVHATGNALIVGFYASLRDRQLRMGAVNLLDAAGHGASPARMRHTIEEHSDILEAVRSGSVRAAEKAVADHLDHAEAQLRTAR